MRVLKSGWLRRVFAILLVVCMLPINAYAANDAQDLGANPEYTVQYYAEVDKLVTKSSKDTNNDLAVIDTAKAGKLPTNTSIDEMYITLDSNGKPVKKTAVEPIFKSKSYKFFDAPNLSYMDMVSPAANNLPVGNGAYELKEVWVLKSGKSADSTNKSDWNVFTNPSEIVFVNNTDVSGSKIVNVTDDTVIRLVYDKMEQSTAYSNAVQMFDYDITDGKVHTSNGKKYVIATENGINSDGNYASGSTVRYAFGNANMGVKHQDDKYNSYYINRATKNSATDTNIRQCSFGLVKNTLSNGLPVFNMAAPDIFSKNAVTGKNVLTDDWSLGFIQDGDSYTLSTVNDGSKNVLTNLESLRKAGNYDHIKSNFFWPLDGTYRTIDGKTYNPGNGNDAQFGDSNLYKYIDGAVSSSAVPGSDEATGKDILHNTYFGMNFEVEFEIKEGYIGPLEYLFFGDDDMWVYLDGKLIVDIGGVHSSVGEYVDLWDYLDKDKAAGKHTLEFFYVERGASGSSCYMYFTLPSVTERQQTVYGDLKVTKEVEGTETKEEFAFDVVLTGIAQAEGVTNIYPYAVKDADGNVKSTGYVVNGKAQVMLADGDSVDIPYLPIGAEYTVTEAADRDYVANVNGKGSNEAEGDITENPATNNNQTAAFVNVYNKKDISGSKTWVDNDNQDGARPESITINLLANGEVIDTKTVTEADDWSWTFEDVYIYDENREEIVYTVTEEAVEGYVASYDGLNVTNTHDPEKTSVSGSKTWKDNDNQDGKRPESITINLLANGEVVDSKEVTAADGWTWTFEDLTKYEAGKEIVYTVTEEAVEGYETSYDGMNVTNTYEPEKTSVSGVKTWEDADNQDGKRPESITINLLANGEVVASKEVTAADDWAWTFEGLDKYAAGEEIVYTITEETVEGYVTSYDGYDVTNTYEPEKTEVSGSKTWVDNDNQDGVRPDSITINLLANGEVVASKEVTAADNWTWTFDNLDKYASGKIIEYTITEDAVAGYETSYADYDVTNVHTPEKTEVSGSKTWADANNQDGIRPESITIHLLANGEVVDTKEVTAEDNWAWTFTNLPKYSNGVAIKYTITEDAVDGYTTVVEGYSVMNTHEPEKTEVSGSKTWVDNDNQDGKRPESITVNLLANGEVVASKEVTAEDNWTWTFDNLDKYAAGEEIIYTVVEEAIEGYNPVYDGLNITNTYDPEKINIVGNKIWNDDFDRDGIRPAGVTIYLYADGKLIDEQVVTALTGWTYAFNGLDRYRDGGVEIVYTIGEKRVPGYVTTIVGNNVVNTHIPELVDIGGNKIWDDNNDQDGVRPDQVVINLYADGVKVGSTVASKDTNWKYLFKNLPKYRHHGIEIVYTVDEVPVDGYTTVINGKDVVNTHVPEEIVVGGTKTWDDANNQDGIRPESITINLYADGKLIASQKVTEADGWAWAFANLPKYRDGGIEIEYVIDEEVVDGYETVINGFDVTNTHVPEKTSVSGTKTWDDEDDKDGIRPESIEIHLLANGEVVDSVTVTEADDWTWTFDNLDKYAAGEEIEYTIDETDVEGYEKSIDGYDVTNTHVPEEEVDVPEEEEKLPPETPDTPETGDRSNLRLYLVMMLMAVAAMKGTLEYKRSLKRRRY